jgi:hypothetical protein
VQDPNNSSLVTALIEATPQSCTVEPFPTNKLLSNKELKLAHRNQTIYEICHNNNNNNIHNQNNLVINNTDDDYDMASSISSTSSNLLQTKITTKPLLHQQMTPPLQPQHPQRPTTLKFVSSPNATTAASAVAKTCAGQ